jgi:hypothetical protein
MATLKDVQNAMNGDQAPVVQETMEFIPEPVFEQEEQNPVNNEFVVFKLANSNRDGGVHIPGLDYVIDPRTITKEKPNGNGPEMIRLITGVPTIWAKEQEKLDLAYIKKNIRTISFPRGSRFITVPTWDATQIEFMRHARHNTKNPLRKTGSKTEYFEYDPNEQAKALLDKEMLEIEMVALASQQPIEKIKPHAFYLGIKFDDEYGFPKPVGRLKAEYMLAAKRDPKRFKETVDSEEVNILYMLRKAILDGKIDISKGDGYAYYAGGARICLLPKTEKPMKTLTELAITKNKEGREFKEQLKKITT